MYGLAIGCPTTADFFSRQCDAKDYALPPVGVDCSWNYGPPLRAGRQDWPGLEEILDHYWEHGAGNEFNSPLYSARVYVAACIGHLLGGRPRSFEFLARWTAFFALQAVIGSPPAQESFTWAGEPDHPLDHHVEHGVLIPPTGMRTNGDGLANQMASGVLAQVLGVGHHWRRVPRGFINWRLPHDRDEWAKIGNPWQPFAYPYMVQQAELRAGRKLADEPTFYRKAIAGDVDAIRELVELLTTRRLGVVLPQGIKSFTIERRGNDVMTFWTGISPTRQKPSCPAAKIEASKTSILMPAKFAIPATMTRSTLSEDGRRVIASADAIGSIGRLDDPDIVIEFRPGEPPSVE